MLLGYTHLPDSIYDEWTKERSELLGKFLRTKAMHPEEDNLYVYRILNAMTNDQLRELSEGPHWRTFSGAILKTTDVLKKRFWDREAIMKLRAVDPIEQQQVAEALED